MNVATLGSVAIALVLPMAVAQAQGYRVRVDTRAQTVAYRGVTLDSVPATDTVSTATGPRTSTGYGVTCIGTSTYCTYYRAGAPQRGAPVTSTVSLALWGLGVPGLSVHANARATANAASGAAWPTTAPAVQLLEGYVEYRRDEAGGGASWTDALGLRVGRQLEESRLGYAGFDGARLAARSTSSRFDAAAWAGWGLARGLALPVTSPVLNPLDEFRPQRRQLVAGATAAARTAGLDARAVYQREVDPEAGAFVSERLGVDVVARLASALPAWSVSGGADYDVAAGLWGSAETFVRYAPTRAWIDASLGARRYRPHFDLWTIWGAFSPVPYTAAEGSMSLAVPRMTGLRVRARGQRYAFDDADVSTPLVAWASSGWRYGWGATYARSRVVLDAGYHAEFGPGAASRGFEGAVSVTAADSLLVTVYGSTLDRPLEFRFDDATVATYGASAEYRVTSRLQLALDATGYSERRDRIDVSGFDWNQLRVSARVTLLFGSGADGGGLPPAVQRMPGGRSRRGVAASTDGATGGSPSARERP